MSINQSISQAISRLQVSSIFLSLLLLHFPLLNRRLGLCFLLLVFLQGPKTQVLFNLQVRVAELPQLRQSKYRFNAFLFGLLK